MGVCSSLGFSLEQIIEHLKSGTIAFERPAFDPDVVTCPVKNFDFRALMRSSGRSFKDRRYLNRGAQFCMASALQIVSRAGLSNEALAEAGLFLGTGPHLDIGAEFPFVQDGRLDRKDLMALWMLKFLPNTAASVIAKTLGLHGENLTVNTACAASLQAIGEAYRKVKDGYLDLALAGGGDSRLNPGGILAYKKAQALYSGTCAPESASRPFDAQRNGFVPGEGGAVFLLEELGHARRRGAEILAEVCGFSSSMDGHNMTAPDPDAVWSEKAVCRALKESGLAAEEIDAVSTHGTGTPLNDQMEAELIERVFKAHRPSIIALKSWIGHIAAACGAVELAVSLSCLRHHYLPEIRNLDVPCHPDLNFVRAPSDADFQAILLQNFGFGGQNSALIIKRCE